MLERSLTGTQFGLRNVMRILTMPMPVDGVSQLFEQGMQATEKIENNTALISAIKNQYALTLSVVDLGLILSGLHVVYKASHLWQSLPGSYKALPVGLILTGFGFGAYSLSQFNIEENVIKACLFARLSAESFYLTEVLSFHLKSVYEARQRAQERSVAAVDGRPVEFAVSVPSALVQALEIADDNASKPACVDSCLATSKSIVKHSMAFIMEAILPATAIATAKLCADGIQTANAIDNNDEVKNNITKQYTMSSFIINTAAIVNGATNTLFSFYNTWKFLTPKQRVGVTLMALTGVAEGAFSLSQFGSESNLLQASVAAGVSGQTLTMVGEVAVNLAANNPIRYSRI